LGLAVSERPVLLFHFDKADKNILPTQAEPFMKAVCYRLVKGPLLIDGSPFNR
jgi:hypothetical protein